MVKVDNRKIYEHGLGAATYEMVVVSVGGSRYRTGV